MIKNKRLLLIILIIFILAAAGSFFILFVDQWHIEINDGSENNFTNLRKDLAKAFESEFPDAKEVSISSCSYSVNTHQRREDEPVPNNAVLAFGAWAIEWL